MKGWWNMPCWNGLTAEQQDRLIHVGNLPIGYTPGGTCQRGATCCIETGADSAPGPRFYCYPCAIEYLQSRLALCCNWPHIRPCGPTGDSFECACGCTGADQRCGTYSSAHPDDADIPEGVVLGRSQ